MVSVGEASFDLQYDGKLFGQMWEEDKRKSAFNWQNKDKKHDPYKAQTYGDKVETINKPTSREVGFSKSINMQNEEGKDQVWEELSPDQKLEQERKRRERQKKQKDQEDRRRRDEKRENEAAVTFGFDHGFGNLASYNDEEVGENDFRTSHSAAAHEKENIPAQPKEEPKANTASNNDEFQFNFGDEPQDTKGKAAPQKGASFNLNDLLAGDKNSGDK